MTDPISPISPIKPLTWWKYIYDAKTSTWGAYGRVAFVQADTEDAARVAGFAAAMAEYPASEIVPFDMGPSTESAAAAFAARRQRMEEWLSRTRTGEPNPKGSL